jgi:hypothetical protein
MSTPTPDGDGEAVRAKGQPITLDDGSEVLIRVDLDNLWLIEEEYGSLGALYAELEVLDKAEGGKTAALPDVKVFQPLIRALAVLMPWRREDLRDPATLRRVLDPALFNDYLDAAVRSLGVALGTSPSAAQDGHPNPQTSRRRPPRRRPAGSPGGGSTMPAPSSSDAQTSSSGG